MKLMRKALAASTLALVPLALAASPASAQPQIDVVILSPAYLDGQSRILLRTEVTCPADTDGFIQANVQQTRRGARSTGFAFTSIDCTGATQTVWFTVASSSGPDFTTGRAYAEVLGQACDQMQCGDVAGDETFVRVRR